MPVPARRPARAAGAADRAAAGETDLAPHLAGLAADHRAHHVLGDHEPVRRGFDHLTYLVRYPYGCIEQTTSTTRPLLYVSHLVGSVDPALAGRGAIEDMVLAGINRMLSMQTPSGGFGYWPGDTEPTPGARRTPRTCCSTRRGWATRCRRSASTTRSRGWSSASATTTSAAARTTTGTPRRRALHALRAAHRRQGAQGAHPEAHRGARRTSRGTRSASSSTCSRRRSTSRATAATRRTCAPRRVAARRLPRERLDLLLGPAPARLHAVGLHGSLRARSGGERWRRWWRRPCRRTAVDYYTTQELVWGITGLGKRSRPGRRTSRRRRSPPTGAGWRRSRCRPGSSAATARGSCRGPASTSG